MTDPTREAFDLAVDLMRDVYMSPSQRKAYERILQAALSARAQGGVTEGMVAKAIDAYAVASGIEPHESDMRAALQAALTQTEAE